MAEVSANNSHHSSGKVRAKKQSTRIDMTPMVDLAFLLLTFFILTTSFRKPYVLELTMPEPLTHPSKLQMLKASNAFNVVLGEDNKIYCWAGLEGPVSLTNYANDGIRKILLERGRENPHLMVLIKPMDDARYENMVDILDEITITKISRYAIVDFTDDDRARLP